MALSITQVEGFYVSSSLPKALFVPVSSSYSRNKNTFGNNSDIFHYKIKKKPFEKKNKSFNVLDQEPPVSGRQHLSVQTDLYLEELCDIVEEVDAQCETDPFFERPPSPIFIPAKTGSDAATQIYSGELLDFDEEFEPVLSDLQNSYEIKQSDELAELRRLEEQEIRRLEEKKKRLKEQEQAIMLEEEVAEKIVACIYSQNYLEEMVPQVYEKLETDGYFDAKDPEIKEIEESFWPWLLDEVDAEIATLEASCHLLDSLIENGVEDIAETSVISPNWESSETKEAEDTIKENDAYEIDPEVQQSENIMTEYPETIPQNSNEIEDILLSKDPESVLRELDIADEKEYPEINESNTLNAENHIKTQVKDSEAVEVTDSKREE